jgi:hypothetical protein
VNIPVRYSSVIQTPKTSAFMQPQPGRCHRGGADSEHHGWSWHNNRTKLNFNVKVPRGVILKAMTTNGGIRGRDLNSVVEAATTNGNVDVATSEWASARTTNGSLTVAMGGAKWSGEIQLLTTNGSVHASLPASAEFKVRAATTRIEMAEGSLVSKSSLQPNDASGIAR